MRFIPTCARVLYSLVVLTMTLMAATSVGAQTCGTSSAWVPPGSDVTAVDPGTLQIVPPAGFAYVGYGSNMALARAAEIKCSCDCTSTKGNCSPSIFNGNCSCTAKDGCTACSLTVGSAVSSDVFRFGGFADLATPVEFISDPREPRPAAFSALFELPEVQARLDAFLSEIPEVFSKPLPASGAHFAVPDGWLALPVAVAGRAAFVVVPAEWARGAGLAAAAASGGTCSCTSGTCTYDSSWTPKGTLHYCEGNCSGTCTLTMNSVAAPDVTFEFDKSIY